MRIIILAESVSSVMIPLELLCAVVELIDMKRLIALDVCVFQTQVVSREISLSRKFKFFEDHKKKIFVDY
jgi:hypothetical protein